MTVDPPPPPDRPGRGWSLFRAVVLVLWLVTAAANWWTAPRQAGYDEARAAVAENRLTVYQWGDSWGLDGQHRWFGESTLKSRGAQGPIFAWRTDDGRVRWTDTETFDEVTSTGTVDEDGYSGPGAVGLAQELNAAGLDDRIGSADARNSWITGAEAALTLIFLGVLLGGPAPVRGTRWYWFWLTVTVPYALGLVFWLFRDRPWSRTARPALDITRAEPRDRGWFGLVTGILAALLISVIVAGLHSLLGDRWVP